MTDSTHSTAGTGSETSTGSGTGTADGADSPAEQRPAGARTRLVSGPGLLVVWLYGVMSVGAVSRSVYQIATEYEHAPLAYSLSAMAAVVYAWVTVTLGVGVWSARRGGGGVCVGL
ncbi:hypothetical protein ACFWI9_31440, partial [Streptomyces sp. NPDC127084]